MTISSSSNSIGVTPSASDTRLLFGRSRVRIRQTIKPVAKPLNPSAFENITRPSATTVRKIERFRDALKALQLAENKFSVRSYGGTTSPTAASAVSFALPFTPPTVTTLRSTEEINTAPTSFSMAGPNIAGSTATAPWSGLGSTSNARISGTYNGSNGSTQLTFRVDVGGTHGVNDLKVKVYANAVEIGLIDIKKEDAINKVYTLANGLQLTFSAGSLVKNDEFVVNTALLSTSFNPPSPNWKGSTADPTISGSYLGLVTGALKFQVDFEGTHGVNDLKIKVYSPSNALIDTIDIKKEDAIDKIYSLSNGLKLQLGAGKLIKSETFYVNVVALNPSATTPTQPVWNVSTAAAAIGGTYNGAFGTGSLVFLVDTGGTHGVNDLKIKAYDPNGTFIQDINIRKEDPIGTTYQLSGGLTLNLGAGTLIKNETFTVDVQAATEFSTVTHPVRSTGEITVGGVYDGSQGTGALTFYVTQGGTHGTNNISVDVRDAGGTVIDNLLLQSTDPLNQIYTLSNGLTFRLGAGTLVTDESFSISVNHQTGTTVDPNRQFNGVRNNDPRFDVGQAVTAGSFQINGITINVFAHDSLNTVLSRITQSAADVTAVFDPVTESVVLTRGTVGAGESILLENDTSGFLAAAKLAEAVPDIQSNTTFAPMEQSSVLGMVTSGMVQINGTSISIDTEVDSFDDVVQRINASAANVTAVFDTASGRLTLSSNSVSDELVLDSGGTGFFEALRISVGTYKPAFGRTSSAGLSRQYRSDVTRLVSRVSQAINQLYDDSDFTGSTDEILKAFRTSLSQEIARNFDSDNPKFRTDFGVSFNFDISAAPVFRFQEHEAEKLSSSLRTQRGTTAVRDLFFGRSGTQDGLIERLIDVTQIMETELSTRRSFGPSSFSFLA